MLLQYLLRELQVAIQSVHLGREGDKSRLRLGQLPLDMIVDAGSVRLLV